MRAKLKDWPMNSNLPVSGDYSAIMLFRPRALTTGFLWTATWTAKK